MGPGVVLKPVPDDALDGTCDGDRRVLGVVRHMRVSHLESMCALGITNGGDRMHVRVDARTGHCARSRGVAQLDDGELAVPVDLADDQLELCTGIPTSADR